MKYRIILIALTLFSAHASMSQVELCRITGDNWQGISLEFNIPNPETRTVYYDGRAFTSIVIGDLIPSSEEGAPALPVFSRLIEVPQCDGFDIRILDAEYDTILIDGPQIMPVQPSRSKSDTSHHPLVIDNKIYSTDAFYGPESAIVEAVGIARDRHLARLQFSPTRYNPVSGQLIVCRHAVVSVNYRDADQEASLSLFHRYYSPHFASGALAMNSLYPKSISNAAPIRYLIVAHSSFNGQLDSFVEWKRRKGFITDIVYTGSAAVGTTTTSIAAYIQSQYTNATASNPAPTYLLIVGDHEQVPAFTGTTETDHISDLYYISWTSGDNIPDCYCGRFSAQTVAQLTPQVQKTLMYEQYTFADPTFLDRAVLVAGVDGGSSGDYGYTHADPAMDYAATHYVNSTQGFTQVMYFKNNTSIVPSAQGVTIGSSASSNSATVRSYYNQGAGWINYSAHGSATSWGTPNFTTTHVASMTNSQKFGLMIGNCCLTNKFETTTCFGESLLRKDNYCGAVGYIGGSNSTYWYEDFYWAVGLRSSSSIGPTMSMAYNSANLGAYDRFCHTHNEPYSQWALTQGAIMFVGNLAVESSTSSRKLYYWEIYHLMGDPSVMPYLTQAPAMTVSAPSVITVGTSSLTVSAAPYAYIALTDAASHNLVAAAFADASGNATLSLPSALPLGTYELVASAQQYQTAFSQVSVIQPSGKYPMLLAVTPDAGLEAGSTVNVNLLFANLGDVDAYNVTSSLSETSNALTLTPSTFTIDSLPAGDTVIVSCLIVLADTIHDGTTITLSSSTTCDGLAQPVAADHTISVVAPVITVDMSQSALSITPGTSASIIAVVSNSGHATLPSCSLTLTSPTRLLSVGTSVNETSSPFTLDPGSSTTVSFTLHADNALPTGINVPLSVKLSQFTIHDSLFTIYVGNSPVETFENNTYHTTGWTQGTYPWTITNTGAYEGTYCLRSTSALTHNQTAQVSIAVSLSSPDSISFYYSVSSEANYDKFHFLIDNSDQLTQSGVVSWTRAAFLIPAGNHTLTFTYAKDGSVNRNSDCAWIDNITLPHDAQSVSFQNLSLCQGDSYAIDGTDINTSQPTDSSIVRTDADGTVQIIDYSVFPTYDIEHDIAVCDSLVLSESIYTASADINHTFTTVHGCDSITLLHLTVNHSVWDTIQATSTTESYLWNDSTYTEAGIYSQLLATAEGCDSLVTLILTFDSGSVSIPNSELSASSSQLVVYPNPTLGTIHIDQAVRRVALFDASGRHIETIDNRSDIDISQLPAGIYYLQILTATRLETVRILKQ